MILLPLFFSSSIKRAMRREIRVKCSLMRDTIPTCFYDSVLIWECLIQWIKYSHTANVMLTHKEFQRNRNKWRYFFDPWTLSMRDCLLSFILFHPISNDYFIEFIGCHCSRHKFIHRPEKFPLKNVPHTYFIYLNTKPEWMPSNKIIQMASIECINLNKCQFNRNHLSFRFQMLDFGIRNSSWSFPSICFGWISVIR